MLARAAVRTVSIVLGVVGCRCGSSAAVIIFSAFKCARLAVSLPHSHVASDSYSATLVSDCLAELGALHEAGKLLGAKDVERLRLDFHPPVDARREIWVDGIHVEILLLFCRLEQAKRQAKVALMTNRQVGEDEITGLYRPIQISHAGSRYAGQNGRIRRRRALHTTVGQSASLLKTGIEEEVGIVVEGDVLALLYRRTLDNAQLDDWWRIYWSSVAVCYGRYVELACTSELRRLVCSQLEEKAC